MKRRLIRIAVVALLVLFGFGLGVFGKGYTLILDNTPRAAADGARNPPAAAEIVVDGGKGIEILAGERDKIDVKGPFHSVELRVMDRNFKVVTSVRREFRLAGRPMYSLSIAALAGGADSFIEEFTGFSTPAAPRPASGDTSPPSESVKPEEGAAPASPELPSL